MYMEWMRQKDVLHTLQYGIEGIHYTEYNELGYPILLDMTSKEERLNYNDNKDMLCAVIESRERDAIEHSIVAISHRGLAPDFTKGMIELYYLTKKQTDLGRIYPDPVFLVSIESFNEYRASLQSLFQDFYIELIKCNPAEFDALYEE